jgi:hypothetical protein
MATTATRPRPYITFLFRLSVKFFDPAAGAEPSSALMSTLARGTDSIGLGCGALGSVTLWMHGCEHRTA